MRQSWRIAAMPLGRGGGVVGVGVPVGDNTPRVAYRGFISYSHRDAGLGRAIHRKLETYRLPKHVAGRESPRGIIPERLTPIFRDREELSAGESLSDQVQAALAASDCLIVLCSPNAKASQWVSREIELFRQLHPDRPILAGLIDGEPADAFPDALTANGAEPIAADFRKGGDGQRLALLKLIAGMTGTPLDALVQRDAQRQTRRVTAITLASLTAVLVMAALLLMAIRAQREAERQRQQAEGLVEYMLTDLRDRLKGVGRLDVMTAVNERAMGYYGSQGDLSGLSAESLNRRARILHAMGEDDGKRGQQDRALAKFVEAHRATAAVLAREPNNPDSVFAHAQSEFWVGEAAFVRGGRNASLGAFLRYKSLSDKLVAIRPDNADWTKESAYADGNLCTVLLEPPAQPKQAVEHCTTALRKMVAVRKLQKYNRDLEMDIANRHAWLADSFLASGDKQSALKQRYLQNTVVEAAFKNFGSDAVVLERLVVAKLSLSRILLNLDRADDGLRTALEARRLVRNLVRKDPANEQFRKWQNDVDRLFQKGEEK